MVISYKNYLMALGFGVAVATSAQAAVAVSAYAGPDYEKSFTECVFDNTYEASNIKNRLGWFYSTVKGFPKNAQQVATFIDALNDERMKSFFRLVATELTQDIPLELVNYVRNFLHNYHEKCDECVAKAADHEDLSTKLAKWKQMIDDKLEALDAHVIAVKEKSLAPSVADAYCRNAFGGGFASVPGTSEDASLKRMFVAIRALSDPTEEFSIDSLIESLEDALNDALRIYTETEKDRPNRKAIKQDLEVYIKSIVVRHAALIMTDKAICEDIIRLKLVFLNNLALKEVKEVKDDVSATSTTYKVATKVATLAFYVSAFAYAWYYGSMSV